MCKTSNGNLAALVKKLTLQKIKDALLDDEHKVYTREFQEAVILKLASSVLPRQNEHSGRDGEPIQVYDVPEDKFQRIIKNYAAQGEQVSGEDEDGGIEEDISE